MSRKYLHIAPGTRLPLDAVTRATAIVGQRGTGKTSTAVVMAEEAARGGAQLAVVDPTGAWYGLRTSADGKGPGLPVVIFGGHNADVPLEETSGALIADLIIREGYQPVLDLELMTKGKQLRFMAEFCEALYHQNRSALMLVVDEAHRFAPQKQTDAERGGYGARSLGALTDVVTLGRRKGLGAVLVSQRPAKINKDVFEQAEILVSHRLMGKHDRAALSSWLEDAGEDALAALRNLHGLEQGRAIVYAPTFDIAQVSLIRPKETFDSSATPEVGQTISPPKARAEVDLAGLRSRMSESIEKAAAEDPKALREQVARLKRELAERPAEVEQVEVEIIREVPILRERDLRPIHELIDVLSSTKNAVHDALAGLRERVPEAPASPAPEDGARCSTQSGSARRDVASPARSSEVEGTVHSQGRKIADITDVTSVPLSPFQRLSAPQHSILAALAGFHTERLTKVQLATLVGKSAKSGHFNNMLSTLRTAGFIEGTGEMVITSSGLAAVGGPQPATSSEEVIERWTRALPGPAAAIFREVLAVYPNALSKDDLALRLDKSPASGHFNNMLSKLRSNQIVRTVEGGDLCASDHLFMHRPPERTT